MSEQAKHNLTSPDNGKWYAGVTRYQWIVLIIASLGWVFDIFEGQIFVASMNEAMPSFFPPGTEVSLYNNIALGAFLLGGAVGGVLFGVMSDRIGRIKTMQITILFYSLFTCLSAFSMDWWHLAAFRFLVAMGVGGEWAVASSLVAEVFPEKARARVSGIFHASSVFGTYLAIAAGYFIVGNPMFHSEANPSMGWRLGFAVGVLPAFLILWIRKGLIEPESWVQARKRADESSDQAVGRIADLFKGDLARHTFVGVSLAAVGLATFWGAHIFGKNMMRRDATFWYVPKPSEHIMVTPEERAENLKPLFADAKQDALEGSPEEFDAIPKARRDELFDSVASPLFRDRDLQAANFQVEESSGSAILQMVLPPAKGESNPRTEIVQSQLTLPEANYLNSSLASIKARINQKLKLWEMIGMLLATTGGGIGLLMFGPLAECWGRRPAFLFFFLGGLVISLVTFQWIHGCLVLALLLPVFGFLTLGMHSGYAIYFPELYPTRLRATGAGFCFNAARFVVPIMLVLSGYLRDRGMSDENAFSLTSLLYLVGAFVLIFAPETKGKELPK